jgi:hypothetical protein
MKAIRLKFLNGFWGLTKKFGLRLVQLSPVYILVFIAYGDAFLPSPLSDASLKTRTTINNLLLGKFPKDILENDKYNNKRTDKVIEETEEGYGSK